MPPSSHKQRRLFRAQDQVIPEIRLDSTAEPVDIQSEGGFFELRNHGTTAEFTEIATAGTRWAIRGFTRHVSKFSTIGDFLVQRFDFRQRLIFFT